MTAIQASTSPSIQDDPQYLGELMEETGFYQAIRLESRTPLFEKQSEYQKIQVFQSRHYGKILVLDGVLQLTERDANAYNEMMAHMAMFQCPHPKRVLVIGGGDGYVLSEVLKHDSVEHVDHVDLDAEVVDVCKKHFSWGAAWDDPRVHLHITDGAAFIHDAPDDFYDVIVQDSSDPWTWDAQGNSVELPSSALYSKEHMTHLYRTLRSNGVLNFQAESFQIPSDLEDAASWRKQALEIGFYSARYSSISISSYPTGQIGSLVCEKDPPNPGLHQLVQERYKRMIEAGKLTTYYHPRLHESSFDLPLWAEKHMYGGKGPSTVCPANERQEATKAEE